METIHRFNLWGLIDFWAAAVKTGSWLLLSFSSFSLLFCSLFYSVLSSWWLPKNVYTNTLVSQVNKKPMTYIFWALFDGLSSWAKENKPNMFHYQPRSESIVFSNPRMCTRMRDSILRSGPTSASLIFFTQLHKQLIL